MQDKPLLNASGPMVRIGFRPTTDEFRVSVDGLGEAVAYYTNDAEDANDTAEHMKRINKCSGIHTSRAALAAMRCPSEPANS